jgi:hypothetical protein
MIDLAKPMSGLPLQPLGSKRVWANFSHSSFSGTPCCKSDGDGAGEAVHQAADGRSLFGHGDEDFAHAVVGIESDGDVALVSRDTLNL